MKLLLAGGSSGGSLLEFICKVGDDQLVQCPIFGHMMLINSGFDVHSYCELVFHLRTHLDDIQIISVIRARDYYLGVEIGVLGIL